MTLIDDLIEPSRENGVHIKIDYTDKGWQKTAIEFFAEREKWKGFSDTQRQSLAEELMMKYWGEVADHRLRAEQA